MYCFQSWCPGCHSDGIPTLAEVKRRFGDNEFTFVVVQTVFEGYDVNIAERALASVAQHGLSGLAGGHDPGRDGGPPHHAQLSHRGDPVDGHHRPEHRVCCDGFQIDPGTAAAIVGQLAR